MDKPRALPLTSWVPRTVRTPPQILWIITEVCSNQGFLPRQWKNDLKQRPRGKPDAETISSWSYDMEGSCKELRGKKLRIGEKMTQQFFKVATPCLDDHQFREEENGSVGDLSTVCSQIVRVGRLEIFYGL